MNYGAALVSYYVVMIAATSLFSTDDKDNSNEGGGLRKEDSCSNLSVDIAVTALFADCDYSDLFIYRSQSFGNRTDFQQTLLFLFTTKNGTHHSLIIALMNTVTIALIAATVSTSLLGSKLRYRHL